MTAGLSPAQTAAAVAPHRQVMPLIELYFTSGTLLLALGPFDVTSSAGIYTHTDSLMYVKPAAESQASQQGLEIGMSGLDASISQIVATEQYRGRTMRLLKGFLAVDSNALIGTPVPKFIGRIKNMTCTETKSAATVAIIAEHYEIELARAAPLRYSDADQQRLHPGDRGCQYAASTADKQIVWPSKAAQGG